MNKEQQEAILKGSQHNLPKFGWNEEEIREIAAEIVRLMDEAKKIGWEPRIGFGETVTGHYAVMAMFNLTLKKMGYKTDIFNDWDFHGAGMCFMDKNPQETAEAQKTVMERMVKRLIKNESDRIEKI